MKALTLLAVTLAILTTAVWLTVRSRALSRVATVSERAVPASNPALVDSPVLAMDPHVVRERRSATGLQHEIRGRVLDDRGLAIETYMLTASQPGRGRKTRDRVLSRSGEFRVQGLPSGPLVVCIEAAGHADCEGTIQVPHDEPILMRIPRLGVLSGAVTTREGTPIEGAVVTTWQPSPQHAVERRSEPWQIESRTRNVPCDRQGRFEVALIPGSWNLLATATGHDRSARQEHYVRPGTTLDGLRLLLDGPGSIHVTLHPDLGAAQSNRVELVRWPRPGGAIVRLAPGEDHTFESLEAGTYSLALFAAGQEDSLSGFFDDDLRLSVRRVQVRAGEQAQVVFGGPATDPVRVHGRVSQAGTPVPGALVRWSAGPARWMGTAWTDTDGYYELELERHTNFSVTVALATGQAPPRSVRLEDRIADFAHDLELPAGSISGRVFAPSGKQQGEVFVQAVRQQTAASYETIPARVDADGSFSLSCLEAGIYDLFARSVPASTAQVPDYGPVWWLGIAVSGSKPVTGVALELSEPSELLVRVRNAQGKPAGGAFLAIERADGAPACVDAPGMTDKLGRGSVAPLAPGSYLVSATKHDFQSEAVHVTVRSGESVEVELTLRK